MSDYSIQLVKWVKIAFDNTYNTLPVFKSPNAQRGRTEIHLKLKNPFFHLRASLYIFRVVIMIIDFDIRMTNLYLIHIGITSIEWLTFSLMLSMDYYFGEFIYLKREKFNNLKFLWWKKFNKKFINGNAKYHSFCVRYSNIKISNKCSFPALGCYTKKKYSHFSNFYTSKQICTKMQPENVKRIE